MDDREAMLGQVVRKEPEGDVLAVASGADRARFTLFGGHPFNQPGVQGGPTVAQDEDGLAQSGARTNEVVSAPSSHSG